MELPFSNVEIVVMSIYSLIMSIIGILGNTVVLISTIFYNAIQLDRISLLLVSVDSQLQGTSGPLKQAVEFHCFNGFDSSIFSVLNSTEMAVFRLLAFGYSIQVV